MPPSPPSRASPFAPLALALGAVALGHALQIAGGHVHPQAIFWLTIAIAFAALAVALPAATLPVGARVAEAVMAAALGVEVIDLFWKPPGAALLFTLPETLAPFHAALAVEALLAAVIALAPIRLARLTLPSLLLLHLAIGVWIIRTSPSPVIDVYAIHRQSLDQLLHGGNPFAMTFPNIYSSTVMYGPEQLLGGRLNFGYCYPPLNLLIALPGHVLFGDYRYSFLACVSLSAALIGLALPGRRAPLAAALLLLTPRGFYVIEHGWTDPVVGLLVCATVVCAVRAPRLLPVALGLMLVSKQFTFLLIPAMLALLLFHQARRTQRNTVLLSATIGLAVTLPFLLWSPRAFFWDVVALQFHSPFRPDALSYLAFIASLGGPRLPSLVGFAMALSAVALSLGRGARTAAGFASATALTLLLFFAFNKQAFCNYYFLCIAALCAAVAAWPASAPESLT